MCGERLRDQAPNPGRIAARLQIIVRKDAFIRHLPNGQHVMDRILG